MHNGSPLEPREEILPSKNAISIVFSPLHEAAAIGDHELLNRLLASGADRSAKETKHGNTPLHEAAWRGYSKCVKSLCELPRGPKELKETTKSKEKGIVHKTFGSLHSTLLGIRNAGGFSALHLAAQNGHNQSCREILLAGANPNVQNNYGDTPLHTACRYGHAGATRILLSAKCDPLRVNLNGDTALHIACAMGRRKLTRILVSTANALNIQNAQGETVRDIAVRKNLPEIISILDSPPPPPQPQPQSQPDEKQPERDRSSSSSRHKMKNNANPKDKPKNQQPNINSANWSPYGCHYFPDPRSFPSPNLETLPKEPLQSGEQYFLDLAGNIQKGPVGVGNTCYCGPFFRHIEERMSRNKKSIRKYVHKATEKLDNKVQALALKTDDQIEQITRTMLANRVRCEGQRLHLEEWLKRGDRIRSTVAPHTSKSQKDQTNTNTLTRCRSLELLDENNFTSKMDTNTVALARSYDNMLSNNNNNTHQAIIHHDANSECSHLSSALGTRRSTSEQRNSSRNNDSVEQQHYSGKEKRNSISDRERLSCSEKERNSLGERSDSDRSRGLRSRNEDKIRSTVAHRLEELLSKTHEIIQIERMARKKNRQGLSMIAAENLRNRSNDQTKLKVRSRSNSSYEDEIVRQMRNNSIVHDRSHHSGHHDTFFIAEEMKKITSSILGYDDDDADDDDDDNHKDRLDIIDKIGPGAISPEIAKEGTNQKELDAMDLDRGSGNGIGGSGSGGGGRCSSVLSGSSYRSLYVPSVSGSKRSVSSNEDIRKQKDSSHYSSDDGVKPIERQDRNVNDKMPDALCGFYQNACFEDVPSSSSNTMKSDKTHQTQVELNHHQTLDTATAVSIDVDESCELSEMANMKELNELKSRILNGSHWRSQVLRKSAQDMNQCASKDVPVPNELNQINENRVELSQNCNENLSIDLPVEPVEDVYALPPRIKVNELVAKIQGNKSTGSSEKNLSNRFDYNEIHSESSDADDDDEDDDDDNEINHVIQLPNLIQSPQSTQQYINHHNAHNPYQSKNLSATAPQTYQRHPPPIQPKPNVCFPSPMVQVHPPPRIIDTRHLIPKDAYFHELPNKNKLRPIADNPSEQYPSNGSIYNGTIPYTNAAPRSRNPLPSSMSETILYESSQQHHAQQTPSSPSLQVGLPNINYAPAYNPPPSCSQTLSYPSDGYHHLASTLRPTAPLPEKLLSNRKFGGPAGASGIVDSMYQRVYEGIESSTLSIPLEVNASNSRLSNIDPHLHMEQESNNDSGYSTKISGGSSMGPSPSLSANTDPDSMTTRMDAGHSSHPMSYDHYYVSSYGASSLV